MLGGYWESVAIFMGINCLMAVSLYIPMTAGLISLGQGGFMAIGAYVCAVLTKADFPFVVALSAGGCAAAAAGALVGTPALRIRGIYVMILTLGFGEIVRVFFLNFEPTGGASGMGGIRPLTTLSQVVLANVIAFLMIWRIRQLRFGRAMVAIHEDDVAAEAMGINLTRTKLLSFSLGAAIAGIAGGFMRTRPCSSTPTNSISRGRQSCFFLWSWAAWPIRSGRLSERRSSPCCPKCCASFRIGA